MPYIEYAKAMFSLGNEEGKLSEFTDDFHLIRDLIKENPDFNKLMVSASVSHKEKKDLIEEVFKDVDLEFKNFLFVLIDNNRFNYFEDIYQAYKKLLQDENNIMRVVITSPAKLSEERLEKLKTALGYKYAGKKIIINNKIDESLIGGIKVYYNGEELDASIARQLNDMRNLLWKG